MIGVPAIDLIQTALLLIAIYMLKGK